MPYNIAKPTQRDCNELYVNLRLEGKKPYEALKIVQKRCGSVEGLEKVEKALLVESEAKGIKLN